MKNKEIETSYFILAPYAFFVKGARRGALYDVKNGQVFAVNAEAVPVVEQLEKGATFEELRKINYDLDNKEILDFLLLLKKNKLITSSPYSKKWKISPPKTLLKFIWVEVTRRCNLKCIHCYVNSNSCSNEQNYTTKLKSEKWVEVIKDAHSLGAEAIQFIGGEPFLMKGSELLNLVKKTKDLGYKFIEIFTNCTLLNEEILDFLTKYNVAIATSVYGNRAEIHDAVTQIQGSFNNTIQNIEKILKRGIKLRVGIVEVGLNKPYLNETVQFLERLGVKKIKIDSVRPAGKALQFYKEKNFLNTNFKQKQLPYFSKFSYEFFSRVHYYHNCFGDKVCITDSGEVLPCIMARNIILGNVLTNSLKDILIKSKEIRELTKDKIEKCKDCEFRYCCFDCRIKAMWPNKKLISAPTECNYNPYI